MISTNMTGAVQHQTSTSKDVFSFAPTLRLNNPRTCRLSGDADLGVGVNALRNFAILSNMVLLSGCANTFGRPGVYHAAPSMIAIAQPANVRSAYTNGTIICPEPPPDAALQAVANAAVKASSKAGASIDVSGGLTTSVMQLAGRTQTVLIARDAFTTNCILRMNGFISETDAENNFLATLRVVQAVASADKAAAEADATNAKTEKAKVAIAAAADPNPAVKHIGKVLAGPDSLEAPIATNTDIIVRALSDSQGVFVPARSAKFFDQEAVKRVLPNGAAAVLGKSTDAATLRSYLEGIFFTETGPLADLALQFKE